jgi:small ligand-binding sensory domain FIST
MTVCRAAHAAAPHWTEAAVLCAERLEDQDTGRPGGGLGFVYATDHFSEHMTQITDHFREATGVESWIGTVGFGICAAGHDYFDEPAISVLIADLPRESFRVIDMVRDVHAEADALVTGDDPSFGVVHADPRHPDIAGLIEGLAEQANGYLVGGLTSSRGTFPQVGREIADGGLSGVLLASDVPVVTALSQSCEPLGPYHDVTECEDNIAIELDGRSAVEVFAEDVVAGLGEEISNLSDVVLAAFPIVGSDTGDYLARQLVGFDSEHGVIGVNQRLSHGDRMMFCRRDREAAERDFRRMLTGLKDRLPGPPTGGLYYSCLARGPSLFGTGGWEVNAIRETLGEFPLTGFFCNGEISHNRLYTFTGVLSLFV